MQEGYTCGLEEAGYRHGRNVIGLQNCLSGLVVLFGICLGFVRVSLGKTRRNCDKPRTNVRSDHQLSTCSLRPMAPAAINRGVRHTGIFGYSCNIF